MPALAPALTRKTDHSPAEASGPEVSRHGFDQSAGIPLFLQRRETAGAPPSQPEALIEEEEELAAIQTKLVVNTPGDSFEQEADAVAQLATGAGSSRPGSSPPVSSQHEPLLQRKPSAPAPVHSSAQHGGALLPPDAGSPLSDTVRSRFEPVLRADLASVRVHTSSAARQTAGTLRARAFTNRDHIWLGPGESQSDESLIAHELTHVVQQSAPQTFSIGSADSNEREADRASAAVLRGERFPVVGRASTTEIQRMGRQSEPEAQVVNVFANHRGSPGVVCEVAGVAEGDERGQRGWDIGINYSTLADLNAQIRERNLRVRRLAILAHGLAGSIDIEGESKPPITASRLRAALANLDQLNDWDIVASNRPYELSHYQYLVHQLQILAGRLEPSGIVLFVGCLAGEGIDGPDLLRVLSSYELLGREVVAFTTVTAVLPGYQSQGMGCTRPGSSVTNLGLAPQGVSRDHSGEPLVWASETAPHSRIARPDGTVYETDFRSNFPDRQQTETDAQGWPTRHQEMPDGSVWSRRRHLRGEDLRRRTTRSRRRPRR